MDSKPHLFILLYYITFLRKLLGSLGSRPEKSKSFANEGCAKSKRFIVMGKGNGILDGGLPHYGFGGVLARGSAEIGDPVYIDGVRIGHVTNIYSDGFARFEVEPFSVKLDNFIMKGISCYMALSGDFMWKLIPQDGRKMSLKDKASVIICPQGQALS